MPVLHIIQHVPFETAGILPDLARRAGWDVSTTLQYEGMPLPAAQGIHRLIVMGGPMGVGDEATIPWLKEEKGFLQQALASQVPVLGICLGAQLLSEALGGQVRRNSQKEIGFFETRLRPDATRSRFFNDFPLSFVPLHWHGDTFSIPKGAIHTAESEACANQAFVVERPGHIGLQFHLEMTPELLSGLIAEDDDELVAAPFVQTAETMRSRMDAALHLTAPLMEGLFRKWLESA